MKKIGWNSPKFGKKEYKLVKEVLDSGYVSEGPMTKKLEEKLSKIVDAKHIIMTTSCTAALYLAIEADKRIRGYKEGEVVIPNLSFVATKNAVELAGLTPKIADVSGDKFLLLGKKIKEEKIIIPVNLLGRGNYLNGFSGDCTIIYDNAGCLGSSVPNGKVGCYSLQANKLITSAGQGGFCATDDDEYARVIRQLKDFGRENKDQNNTTGFNFKFNDLQSAVALGQLERLENRKHLHAEQHYKYKSKLSEYGQFIEYNTEWDISTSTVSGEIPLWVEFITSKRDELYDYLLSKGIECRKPWKPINKNSIKYPNTDYYTKNCIWLPSGASLTSSDQEKVIREIKKFYEL